MAPGFAAASGWTRPACRHHPDRLGRMAHGCCRCGGFASAGLKVALATEAAPAADRDKQFEAAGIGGLRTGEIGRLVKGMNTGRGRDRAPVAAVH